MQHKTTEDMMNNLQQLKGKSKTKVYQNRSICYDETKYRFQSGYLQFGEDLYAKIARSIGKVLS